MTGGTGWRLTMMDGLRGPLDPLPEPLGGGLTREPADLLDVEGKRFGMGPVALKVLPLLEMPSGGIVCAANASTASGAETSVAASASAEDASRLMPMRRVGLLSDQRA